MSVEHLIGTYAAPIEFTPDQQNGARGVIVDIARENYAKFNEGVDLVCLYSINFSQDRNTKTILYKHGGSVYGIGYKDIDEELEDIFHTERSEDAYEPIRKRAWLILKDDPTTLPHNVKPRSGERVGIELIRYTLKSKAGQRNSINIIRYFGEEEPDKPLAETWFAQRERYDVVNQVTEPQQQAA